MKKYSNSRKINREVICADALEWLKLQDDLNGVITSLPDWDETNVSDILKWRMWFINIVEIILNKLNNNGYAFFYQSDRKYKGHLIDKSYLCNIASQKSEAQLLWHKIALKQEPDSINLIRPTFTHLLLFGKNNKPGKANPDVFYTGKMIYNNAMGLNACKLCCEFFRDKTDTIIDPFCGQGSVLAIANYLGFNSIGIEILESQCRKARKLTIIK